MLSTLVIFCLVKLKWKEFYGIMLFTSELLGIFLIELTNISTLLVPV